MLSFDREENEYMVRDPYLREPEPDPGVVLNVLEDPTARAIIHALDSPLSAQEIADHCDIPVSTTYRKLERLTDATLLEELTELRADGHHTARYRVNFTEVEISLAENRVVEITITRPSRTPDEQLAVMWSEVQQEAR